MNSQIVITGMGLICPLGRNLDSVWKKLAGGHSGLSRWNGEWGGRLAGLPVGLADDFREDADRASRFAQEAALDALRDAGLGDLDSAGVSRERIGLAIGSSKGSPLALEQAMANGVSAHTIEAFLHDSANRRIMQKTGIVGPCISAVSACATGAHSIAMGASWIQEGMADVVLAGATESALTPMVLGGFHRMGVLTQDRIRPYDRGRDGFVVGEGAGVLVLEDAAHARGRGARAYARLSGWGFSADAYKPVSFDPGGDAIDRAILACTRRAGIRPQDLDYINCHGTGTRENDSIESRALSRLLGEMPQPALSSTKPLTGHLLGAAGSVESIVTVLSLAHRFVPPTVHLTDPDPDCPLDFTPGEGRPRRMQHAMSLSYGFGGHVSALGFGLC